MWMLNIPAAPSAPVDAITVDSNALELGVLLFVDNEDLDAFVRNISQLKPRYAALASLGAVVSTRTERKCHVLGLNLMHLLLDNRLSEFHADRSCSRRRGVRAQGWQGRMIRTVVNHSVSTPYHILNV